MRQFLILVSVFVAVAVQAEIYDIDSEHSEVGFRVKHLVGKVPGRFTKFSGTIDFTPGKPKIWKVDAAIDPASINTDNEKRDNHLRSADFFDVAKYPAMTFKSTKITIDKSELIKLYGELTMHGVTKPVVLNLEIGGTITDPWGNQKAGFSAKGEINRKDFGIVWNKTLDSGGLILGDDITVNIELEAQVKPPEKPILTK